LLLLVKTTRLQVYRGQLLRQIRGSGQPEPAGGKTSSNDQDNNKAGSGGIHGFIK